MSKIEIDALLEEDRKRLLDAAHLLGSFAAQAAVHGVVRLLGHRPQSDQTLPATLSCGQAAKFLGVTSQTIRNWIKQGVLLAEQHADGTFRIRREDLQQHQKDV